MRAPAWLLAACLAPSLAAQQGWLPLSRTVDDPFVARMHAYGQAEHTSVRPLLREDAALLPGADSLLPKADWPWLQRITDPAARLHGGPLIDAMAGASLGEEDPFKARTGLGAWLEWNASPRWTLEADAESWAETFPNYLDSMAARSGVAPGEGRAYGNGPCSHMDWGGYADYKAGQYFHLTLGKGKQFIGEGLRSLFLSDEAASYPYFRITTTAWHIRYVNLYMLLSDFRPDGRGGWAQARKFTSLHYLSWNVSKRVNAGFFEAVVWQDNDPHYPRGFDLAYLNPVIFYRPVEYGLGSPDNALLGLALNVKVGRHALVYSQLILDEFLLDQVRAGEGWFGNKQGVQLGTVAHDAFRVQGLTLRAELDYVRPFLYSHSDARQNYAHLGQPLAHPYGSNFLEGLGQVAWKKGRWTLDAITSVAVMGQDSSGASWGNDIFRSDMDRPRPDGVHAQANGFYLGRPLQGTVVQEELRVGRAIEPRSGLMLELAWTLRSEDPGTGGRLITDFLRVGVSTGLRDRHPFQVVRR